VFNGNKRGKRADHDAQGIHNPAFSVRDLYQRAKVFPFWIVYGRDYFD